MNKMQVRSTLETMSSMKDELIEEKKKVAEELAYIEEQIEAIMILIPVFMKRDNPPEVKIMVPPAHLEDIVKNEPEDKIAVTVIDAPVKAEVIPPPEAVRIKVKKVISEKDRIAKHEWYLANRGRLRAAAKKDKPNYFGDGE